MIVIAVANQKGGVGKTNITRELSACCAMRGYQVLAIDCDSQGSLTRSWIEMQSDWLTLSNVLIEPESAGRRGCATRSASTARITTWCSSTARRSSASC